jgi:hypothetical protein
MGTTGLLQLSYLTTSKRYFCPMWSEPPQVNDEAEVSTSGAYYDPPLNANSYLVMQADGNLVISPGTSAGSTVPLSNTPNNPGAYLEVGDDGNLVVYDSAGNVLWQSGTNLDRGSALCTGASLSGGQLLTVVGRQSQTSTDVLVMQTDCNLVYYANSSRTAVWSSDTSTNTAGKKGSPLKESNKADYDHCYAIMQGDGNLVIYAPTYPGGRAVLWASGTSQSSSPPNLVENLGPYSLVNPGQVYLTNPGIVQWEAEIFSDSGTVLWQSLPPKGLFASNGSTAVSVVQLVVGILTFVGGLL